MKRKADLTKEEMFALMAFADGEAQGDTRLYAERLLSEKADAIAFVRAQIGMRAVLQGLTSGPQLSINIADAVMAQVEPPAQVLQFPAHRRSAGLKWGAGIAAAVALAAGAALMLGRQHAENLATAAAAAAGVEVSGVDSPNPVSVFLLPSSMTGKASSVVIWIDDNEPAPSTTASASSTAPILQAPPSSNPSTKAP